MLFISCKKENSGIIQINELNKNKTHEQKINFTKSGYFTKLKPERQKLAFGKWKLTNLVYTNYNKKITKKIPISISVNVNENGIYDFNNNLIAKTFESKIGTYKFLYLKLYHLNDFS